MKRQPKYSREYEEFYGELTREGGDGGFFKHKKDIFIVAMLIGFKNKYKVELNRKIAVQFTADWSEENYDTIIYSVALAATGSTDILKDEEEMIKIAEDYAAGGIELLHRKMKKVGKTNLEWFEDILIEDYTEYERRDREVNELIENILL